MSKKRPKNNGSTVAAYIRVSTTGQNLSGQKRCVRDWLKRNNIDEGSVKWYADKKTGRNIDRTNLQRLMKAVDQGKLSMVVCVSLNRLARSLHHGVALLQSLCEKNVRVVSITEQLDFSGIMGRAIAALLFGLAQADVESRRTAIVNGMAIARENGKHIGRPRDQRKLQRIRKLYDEGMPAVQIAAKYSCSRSNIFAALQKTA